MVGPVKPEDLLYAALDRRHTERVPTLSLLADPNIMNQVLGRPGSGRVL